MKLNDARVILYHKQATSARTLFVRHQHSICLLHALPDLAQLLDTPIDSSILIHPAPLLAKTEIFFGMRSGTLELEKTFHAQLDVPHGLVTVFLARILTIDPPRELIAKHEAKFIALTEARGLPAVELELLRLAYAVIMEG